MAPLATLAAHPLVHVNAGLNATAAVLLALGLLLIKLRHERAHKWVMLAAFAVSTVFLVCYLWYHYHAGHVRFTQTGPIRGVYYAILASHVLLAMTVPVLAIGTIYLGFRATGCCGHGGDENARQGHRRLARWTFPIWMYVSITGVIVYAMLYHLWPPVVE